MLAVWLEFTGVALVIAVGGYWVSRFGDVIGERAGLSGSWVGLVLLATVTSLPELVSGITSVTVQRAPDLAVGDALGSCLFNLLLLAIVDLAYRRRQMYASAAPGHVLSLGFAVIMLGLVGLNVLSGKRIGALPATIEVSTVANILVYLLALRVIFTFERRQLIGTGAKANTDAAPGMSLRAASIGYGTAAAVVVAAGIWLPAATVKLADAMGWTSAFAGTLFMAIATSLPELAVTLSAVRLGALDMAVAALLGSNLFNMVVLAIDDIVYDGPLLSDASGVNAITLFSTLIANGLVAAGLIYRSDDRQLRTVSWTSLGLVLVYGLNVWLLTLATGKPAGG